ncbi:Mitochondrial import receptor [Dirofilaria immitis]
MGGWFIVLDGIFAKCLRSADDRRDSNTIYLLIRSYAASHFTMVELIIPEDKLKPPPCGLPRMYRKYAPDTSREIYLMEALALNPGTLSNFHEDSLACIGNYFTGVHLAINKFIPPCGLKLNNKIKIRTAQMNGELIAKYITTGQSRFGEHNILVETKTNFMTPWPSISISQAIDDFWYISMAYSPQGHMPKTEVELEYYGRVGTSAFKYTGWPFLSDADYSISYLRSITRKLALGSQLTLRPFAQSQFDKRLSDITYYARYRGPAYRACFDFCKTRGYHFSYFRNFNKYVAGAINIAGSINCKQLASTVAVKTKVPKYGLIIQGYLANNGTICSILKKQFTRDFPVKVAISGFYNFYAGNYGFGISLSL